MKTTVRFAVLSLLLLTASASAQTVSLNLTNRTGTTITTMTAAEKTAPDVVRPFVFPNQLTEAETDKATIDLPEGVCASSTSPTPSPQAEK